MIQIDTSIHSIEYIEARAKKSAQMGLDGVTEYPEHSIADFIYKNAFDAEKKKLSTCKKCNGEMKPSKAIVCRATGKSDFIGDGEAVTMSLDPKQPVLVDCLKCVACGWSVSKGTIA